jgi:hypothetical protein
MKYPSCERCVLEIKVQAACLRLDNCPRRLGRSGIVAPLISRAAADPKADPTTRAARDRWS